MAISRLLVLTVTLLSVPAEAEAARGGVAHFNTAERLALFQVNGQQGAAERIRRYQGDLAKTGPEARVNREVAVDSLFSMDHDVAHTVLQSYAGRGTDRRDVRRQVVGKLAIHLRNSEHAVFARSENASRYRRNYAKSLVQHFTVEVSVDPGLTELRNLAREALFALELGELRAAFDEMILDEDLDLRRRVLYAAGESRKLQLAPWIVEYIDDGEVGPAARTALANLTYTPDLDKRSFVDWWERNKGRTYMDLTEEAARGGSESAKAAKRGMDRRFFDMVDTTIELLVDTDKNGRWKEIAGYVEDVSPGMMQNTLRKLRDVLAPNGVTDDGDDAQERLDFCAELVGLYETPEYGDEVRALLLEVTSYLCVAGDQDQGTRLVTALNSGNEEITTAALLGMSRFFSPANRREVVGVIRDAHENGKIALLGVAIDTLERTLKSGDWQAPTEDDEDLQEWIDGLFGVLEDESLDALDAGLRQGVIDIFFESQNLMPVFNRFRLLVERDRTLASLRRKMIPVLFDLVPPDSETAELQALETLLELYEDAEPEIRLAAAKTYSGEILQDLREKLAQGIGDRLQLEDDNRVLGEFVSVLTQLAEEEDLVSTVNSRLRAALELVADENKAESLAKGLYEVAMQDDQNLTEWLRTCEILLELRPDRKLVWPILEKHRVALDTADTELQEKFARVVMDNAGLRPVEPGWRDASAQTEAKLVITWGPKLAETASYAEREEEKKIADRMIYLRCLAATEAYSALVTKAEEWVDPADILFSGRDLDEVRLLHAEGGLGQNQISAAWTEISRVVDPNDRRSTVDVPVDIARQAAGLLREICEATDADMLEVYWPRFNIYLRLRYQVGEEEASELLRELNQWAEPRTASFTPETADELASLRALLSN